MASSAHELKTRMPLPMAVHSLQGHWTLSVIVSKQCDGDGDRSEQ